MNITQAIRKLELQKLDINAALRVLYSFTENGKTASKLLKELNPKKRSFNGKHWTQTAAGKKKLSKQGKAMWKRKRANNVE